MHHPSPAACPTLVTTKLYSARSLLVGLSVMLCDAHVRVSWADHKPMYGIVINKVLIDMYSIVLLLSTLLYLIS